MLGYFMLFLVVGNFVSFYSGKESFLDSNLFFMKDWRLLFTQSDCHKYEKVCVVTG